MSVTTVQVTVTNRGRWAVETDDGRKPAVAYPSRAAAIAAGVHLAMEEDAILVIHGVSEESSTIDFRCVAKLVD